MSQQKQVMDMKTTGTNYFMLRLALLIAPFAVVDGANAACAPTSQVNNITVTCTGPTANQNGTEGYCTNTDIGNTDNILSGASVTGADSGLIFNTAAGISARADPVRAGRRGDNKAGSQRFLNLRGPGGAMKLLYMATRGSPSSLVRP